MSVSATAVSCSKSWCGPALQFNIIKECSKSRCRTANLVLPHHSLETPTFMPVGTKGTMKGLLPEQVAAAGVDIILGNTYHLGTQPGKQVLNKAGGLHKWMNWNRALLTDSGGFQMVSLLKFAKITEEGVTFQSPYDGSECLLTPEESISIQNAIGADIMMQLDDVVDVRENDYDRFKEATLRTTRWLDRCIAANSHPDTQNLFPIVQGGLYTDLRDLSLTQLMERDSPGYAVGGLSGGEDKHQFWSTVHQCTGRLPVNKPRYCMGVGYAPDLVVCVALGVDMFDCVYPTRTARFGCALMSTGQISLKSEQYSSDLQPVDPGCDCRTCKRYTRAYIHAALAAKATVGCHLLSVHNIAYQMRLMHSIRASVRDGRFSEFVSQFMYDFYGEKQQVPQWITDALASVNIQLKKGDCGPAGFKGDGRRDQETLPLDKEDNYLNIRGNRQFINCSIDPSDSEAMIQGAEFIPNTNIANKPSKSVCSTDKMKRFGDWCDGDQDESDDGAVILSGFESRAYDQGYREAVRRDYPIAEEQGRIAGFREAFNASFCNDNGAINNASKNIVYGKKIEVGIDDLARSLETVDIYEEHSIRNTRLNHPIHALAVLEGSLSLMLLKFQTVMSDVQLREAIGIREETKKGMERIAKSSEDYCYDLYSKPCTNTEECCGSKGTVLCSRDTVDKVPHVTDTSSVVGTLFNKPYDKDRLEGIIVFNDTVNNLHSELYQRASILASKFKWSLPALD